MRRSGCAVTTAALLGAAAGCSQTHEIAPSLVSVDPAAAYNDTPVVVDIDAVSGFRPAYRIDTGAGTTSPEAASFQVFLDPSARGAPSEGLARVSAVQVGWSTGAPLVAVLPAHIPAGTYDVVVVDPRGVETSKPASFISLGPDVDPPALSIDLPGAGGIVAGQGDLAASFFADDGAGHLAALSWRVYRGAVSVPYVSGQCPSPDGAAQAVCSFSFPIPLPGPQGEPLRVEATARDSRDNLGFVTATADLVPPPVFTSLSPGAGPAAGGTLLTVQGDHFIPYATQIFLGETPLETSVLDTTVATAVTPWHDPVNVPVSVRTGGASAGGRSFEFVASPSIRLLLPQAGASGGGTAVSVVGNDFRSGATTILFVGADDVVAQLRCPTYRGRSRIDGYAPPGSGTVALVANDPIGGAFRLEQAFSYDDAVAPDLPPDAECPVTPGSPP